MGYLLPLALPCVSGFFLGVRPLYVSSPAGSVRMDAGKATTYEEYLRARESGQVKGGSVDAVTEELKVWAKYDLDFDGGDSGGGVVGDGNTDLEDQHNSASVVRGGFGSASVGEGGVNVGRGQVKAATNARIASAGKNYFGRSTGYAEKKMEEISENDLKFHRMDKVRAQQLENWHNQRGIAKENRAAGQGVVFGDKREAGHYIARDALSSSAWREGKEEGVELDQRSLNKHLEAMRTQPTARLDGTAWEEVNDAGADIKETFEMKAPVGGVDLVTISVKNEMNTFAPFQCDFTATSPVDFSVSPTEGSMNRRSGAPTEVTVRFSPKEYGEPRVGSLVFETEDFKYVYQIIGST